MRKRILCLILAAGILLSGCSFFGERIKDPVTFYYLCDSYQEDLCCVIASEEREASGHAEDLPYLLALYLMGPTNDEYISPLPIGAQISVQTDESHVLLEISNVTRTLSDIDYSLICACLTLTCTENTDTKTVTICCGDRVKTMTRSMLTLYDSTSETSPTEEPQ